MTIWFGKEKSPGRLGLHFPRGMADLRNGQDGKDLGQRSPVGREGETAGRLQGRNPSALNRQGERLQDLPPEQMAKIFSAVEIYLPEVKDPVLLMVDELTGIEIGLDRKSDIFSYELKIPLIHTNDNPYGIDARPGETIIVEIDVPKMDMDAPSAVRGAGRPMEGGAAWAAAVEAVWPAVRICPVLKI